MAASGSSGSADSNRARGAAHGVRLAAPGATSARSAGRGQALWEGRGVTGSVEHVPHSARPPKRGASMQALTRDVAVPAVITPAVALRDVRKVHGEGDSAVVALDGVSVGFSRGSFTAIMGPSGSGKSTLLHVAAGLDRPTSGTVALGET